MGTDAGQQAHRYPLQIENSPLGDKQAFSWVQGTDTERTQPPGCISYCSLAVTKYMTKETRWKGLFGVIVPQGLGYVVTRSHGSTQQT